MPADLRSITDFDSLLEYLADELDWPVENYTREELTFEYDGDDLGLKAEEVAKLSHGSIQQLRPLQGKQPFGIFFVEFDHAKLPIVVLRRILSQLVIKKRSSANSAEAKRWDVSDLIFISAFGEEDLREITFAHFHKDPETTELPVLRVLGWHGENTHLKSAAVARTLKNRLTWPENEADQEAWRQQWRSAFKHKPGHTISTAKELATAMAGFARRIRDAARAILPYESENGRLRKLYKGFQDALIHDLSEEDFTTYYAETICYGLFTVAVSKTELSEGKYGTAVAADDVAHFVPVTNPFLKEMLWSFLEAGGRNKELNFDDLGINEIVSFFNSSETDLPLVIQDFGSKRPGEDPVIHLYEDFLKQFDAELRKKRGVFYTPQPVVSYIVRSVHELLQTEFGLEDGLASTLTWGEFIQKSKLTDPQSKISLPDLSDDPSRPQFLSENEPFVQILDPATGTATFPVEVIDVIYKHLKERWRLADSSKLPGGSPHFKSFTEYWNHYVPNHLLPRLHGYELMMAPYAIAHMKIGLKLAETGYTFATEERARIYLTNALEPKLTQLPTIGYEALAHEAAAVNEVKWKKRFTVVIGNPPYSGISSNMSDHALRIVDAYRYVDSAPLNEKKLWLQDDYVKFIRISQTTLENTGRGILGLITNNGFLDNPTFRGMRQSLLTSFSTLHLIDLHGNSSKGEKTPDGSEDKNVFEIKQGVSIILAIAENPGDSAVQHSNIWGDQDFKYQWLNKNKASTTQFQHLAPSTPYYAFVQQDAVTREEYSSWISVWDAFGSYGTGVVTGRDALTIDVAKETLVKRLQKFASLSEDEARKEFDLGPDARDWKVPTAQKDIRQNPPSLGSLVAIQYRPFDARWTHYTGTARGIYASPCRSTMAHMLKARNLGLITARSNAKSANDHFFVTRLITEAKCGESSRQCALFPLRLFQINETENDRFDFGQQSESNISAILLKSIKSILPPTSLTPEDIFHYIYAIFHSPGYRSRYAEFLKIDFPRLPLTGNLELFRELSRLGGELVALHLLEFHMAEAFLPVLPKEAGKNAHITYAELTEFIGPSKAVLKPGWTDGTVWLDSGGKKAATTPGTSGFHGVPENVWNFHIGGYQVCAKWLKDRKGRTLTDEDIAHYQKIVIALSHTIRLMAEIDQVIETHGGWPGAFAQHEGSKP